MKLWVHEYISHLKDFFITPGILRKDFFAYVINIVQRDNLDLFLKDLIKGKSESIIIFDKQDFYNHIKNLANNKRIMIKCKLYSGAKDIVSKQINEKTQISFELLDGLDFFYNKDTTQMEGNVVYSDMCEGKYKYIGLLNYN